MQKREKINMKRILCGILTLTLLLGMVTVSGSPAASAVSANVALGKSVAFGYGSELTSSDGNYSVAAVKAGTSVLTDGVNDSPNWWVNNGNPNIGLKNAVLAGPYVFNLDLGSQSTVRQISAYFYSRTDWGVDAPNAVTYCVSTDGCKWTEVGSVEKAKATTATAEDSRNPDAQSPTIYRFSLNLSAVDARYIKVTFSTNAAGLVGLQEIEVSGVKKAITNLALGRMANAAYYDYAITGGGTGYEATGTTKADGSRYTVTEVELASASRLTDGTVINGSAVTYPSNWASQKWNSGSIMGKYLQIYRNDSRIITLDLGAVRNITGIRMHFAAVEAMGFYMPTNTRPATTSAEGGKLRIYQLPFYQSEGYWNWAEYGFDYALMQPNYSFYDMYTLTQLEESGDLCEYYGLGMQMEFGGAASTAYHEKFKDYLTYGDDFGYQNAVLSWYMSTWGCINMATNSTGTYWGQVSGIAAKNLDDTYYVAGVYTDPEGNSYCTGVIAYSLSRYCLNNAKDGNTMQELAAATAMTKHLHGFT